MHFVRFAPLAENFHSSARSGVGQAFLGLLDVCAFVPDSLDFFEEGPLLGVGDLCHFLLEKGIVMEGDWVVVDVGVFVLESSL